MSLCRRIPLPRTTHNSILFFAYWGLSVLSICATNLHSLMCKRKLCNAMHSSLLSTIYPKIIEFRVFNTIFCILVGYLFRPHALRYVSTLSQHNSVGTYNQSCHFPSIHIKLQRNATRERKSERNGSNSFVKISQIIWHGILEFNEMDASERVLRYSCVRAILCILNRFYIGKVFGEFELIIVIVIVTITISAALELCILHNDSINVWTCSVQLSSCSVSACVSGACLKLNQATDK